MENLLKSNHEAYESFSKSAVNIISYYEGEEREEMLNLLRNEVEKLCEMEERMNISVKISALVSESYDPEAGTEDNRINHVEDYKRQILNIAPNASVNANMKEFDRIVSALKADSDGQDMDDDDADDSELRLTHDTVNVIDPVTKKRMTDPVKNSICSHIYDRQSVVALLNINKNTRCPVPGCKYKEPLSMANMKMDIVTRTYLEKHPA